MDNELLNDHKMIPVPIDDFIMGLESPVDVYVRLASNKYVCLFKAGIEVDKAQVQKYKDKKTSYLWIHENEYGQITKKGIAIAGVLVSQSSIPLHHKTMAVALSAKNVFTEFEKTGLRVESYENAKEVAQVTLSLIEHQNDLDGLLGSLARCSNAVVKHSLAVSVLSVILGQKMNWTSKDTLEKLALGAMLHDVGKLGLPPELLNKRKSEMSDEEFSAYQQHPLRGVERLNQLGVVPDDVVSIVYEHHETSSGQGFPRKIRDVKIHPLAKVVALANQFVNLTFGSIDLPAPYSPRDAIKIIEETMGQPYNKEVFRTLKAFILSETKRQPKFKIVS